MIPKRYTQQDNAYFEDENGGVDGIEWTDEEGTTRRILFVGFPTFDNALRIAIARYLVQVKVGDKFTNDETNGSFLIEKAIDDSKFRYCNPNLPNFGQSAEEPGEDVTTEVQFFLDIIFFRVIDSSASISYFLRETMQKMIEERSTE